MNSTETTRRQRRKEARPAELAAAALTLFVEKGFAATRLDDVAARAGVSKGTLYLYFDSKEALVLDHFGWIGLPGREVGAMRILGAGLLLAGAVLITRN